MLTSKRHNILYYPPSASFVYTDGILDNDAAKDAVFAIAPLQKPWSKEHYNTITTCPTTGRNVRGVSVSVYNSLDGFYYDYGCYDDGTPETNKMLADLTAGGNENNILRGLPFDPVNGRFFVQSTTNAIPKIYDGSNSLVQINNKPALLFDGVDDGLTGDPPGTINELSIFAYSELSEGTQSFQRVIGAQVDGDNRFYIQQDGDTDNWLDGVGLYGIPSSYSNRIPTLSTLIWEGGEIKAWKNGNYVGQPTFRNHSINLTNPLSLGFRYQEIDQGNYVSGKIQTALGFYVGKSSQRSTIEALL